MRETTVLRAHVLGTILPDFDDQYPSLIRELRQLYDRCHCPPSDTIEECWSKIDDRDVDAHQAMERIVETAVRDWAAYLGWA